MSQQLLKVAAHCQLPVIIHCRERRGKFRSPQRPARELCLKHMERNLVPSSTPVHAYRGNAHRLEESLIETDSPYLPPQDFPPRTLHAISLK